MIIIDFFKHLFSVLIRNSYWLYRLSRVSFNGSKKLHFPIIVEGKGKIIFASKCEIKRKVKLGVSEKARVEFDKSAFLESESSLLLSNSSQVKIGKNFKLGEKSKLYISSDSIIGNDVKIASNCSIFARENHLSGKIEICDGSHIGDFTIIDLVDDVLIGKEVAIGPNCTLYTHDHGYEDKSLPSWKGQLSHDPIIIEDGAWIGSSVTILPGVRVGKRTVIAAGSVVTKSVKDNSIYGGVPAKFIKKI